MNVLALILGAAVLALTRDHGDRQAPALIRRALEGNKGALRMLARRLLPVIHARVRQCFGRRGGRPVAAFDAEDLVQEVWLTLLAENGKHLRNYDPKRRASLEGYVLMVTDRELSNRIRAAGRLKRGGDRAAVPLDEALRAPAEASPEDQAVSGDLLRALHAHLYAELPPRGRLVFRYLYTDSLRPARVAEILHVKTQVVYNWQHKIRQLGRAFMDAQGPND